MNKLKYNNKYIMSDKKLIRLTTTDRNCIFSNEFHDEIIIKEKSEIAFHSISMVREPTEIIIDNENDQGTFQIQDLAGGFGGPKVLQLEHGSYSNTNVDTLTEALSIDMNKKLNMGADFEQGTEILTVTDSDGNMNIAFQRSAFHNPQATNAEQFDVTFDDSDDSLFKTTDLSGDLKNSYIAYKKRFIKGCGSFRVRIDHFSNRGDASKNGLMIGLTQQIHRLTDPSKTFTEARVDYFLRTGNTVTDNYIGKSTAGGADIDSGVAPLKYNSGSVYFNHDILDISLSEGFIIGTIYRFGTKTEVFRKEYDHTNSETYYGFISLFSGSTNVIVGEVRCHTDPYDLTLYDNNLMAVPTSLKSNNVVSCPFPQSINSSTSYSLTFPTFGIARYFGFKTQTVIKISAMGTDDLIFIGTDGFQPINDSDVYLIELLNLPLNSFDGFSEGRKNILSVIPVNERNSNQKDFVLQYEANNLNYITLKNNYEFSLRNIKARIVNAKFEPIVTTGMTSLSFFIRQYKE